MDYPTHFYEPLVSKALSQRLDNRIGHALFVGAWLPEIALDLARTGLTITLVESEQERIGQFLETFRNVKMDNSVSVDVRPYEAIEFQGSSYNLMVIRDGIPEALAPALFFKKARRELKAGSTLYLNTALKPSPADLIPGTLRQKIRSLASRQGSLTPIISRLETLTKSLPRFQAPTEAELLSHSDHYLGHIETIPLSLWLDLAERHQVLAGLLPNSGSSARKWLAELEQRVVELPGLQHLATRALIAFSKNKEFGTIFRVQ